MFIKRITNKKEKNSLQEAIKPRENSMITYKVRGIVKEIFIKYEGLKYKAFSKENEVICICPNKQKMLEQLGKLLLKEGFKDEGQGVENFFDLFLEDPFDTLKASQFWNKEYSNFDSRSEEAKELLESLGLKTYSRYKWKALAYSLVGYLKEEPNYWKYRTSWEAKEARPQYSPIIEPIITIEQYEELPEVREKKNKEKERMELPSKILKVFPDLIKEREPIFEARVTEKFEKILVFNSKARKYPYEIFWRKFATKEEAFQEVRKSSYDEELSEMKRAVKEAEKAVREKRGMIYMKKKYEKILEDLWKDKSLLD